MFRHHAGPAQGGMAVSDMPLPGSPLGQHCSRDVKFGAWVRPTRLVVEIGAVSACAQSTVPHGDHAPTKRSPAKRVRATSVFQMLHLTRMIIAQRMVFSWIKSAGAPSDRGRPLRRDFNRIIVYSDLRITARNRSFLWIEQKIS